MSALGMAASVVGFLYAAFVAGLRLTVGTPISGWASLMVVVLVLGGLQMIMLGVLGEYLWRTLEQARQRPRYYIEDSTAGEQASQTSGRETSVTIERVDAVSGGGSSRKLHKKFVRK
jgi:dolichol-phosphate mannosyltransferase